jgi:hypothetical protein
MQANTENAKPENQGQLAQISEQQTGSVTESKAAENDAPQYTADEAEAMKKGWKPKDQFEGEGWRSAREFLERGELLDTIHSLKREVNDYKKSMENVETLIKRREESARKQAMEELTKARREAIQSGDVETVERLDEDIYKARKEIETPVSTLPSDVAEWIENQKSWFNPDTAENKRMMKFATAIEEDIRSANPNISNREALQEVEAEIKKRFPHRFESAARKKPDVEMGTTAAGQRKKPKYNPADVTDGLKKIARDFVRKGVFKSEEEYYESYFGV